VTGLKGFLAAALAGALLPLAFPPYGWAIVYGISWPALILLLDRAFESQGRRLGHAAWIGYGFGVGQFAVGLSWIVISFEVRGDFFAWMEPLALAGIAFGLAVFPAAATALAMIFWRKGPTRLAVLALAWTILEWLRGHILTGFPWNLAGLVFVDSDASIQMASLVGAYGLSLLAVLIGSLPVLILERPFRPAPLAIGLALFGAIILFGFWRLNQPDAANVPDIRLRIVQPNVPEPTGADPNYAVDKFHRLIDLTAEAGHPNLVIWPEAAFFGFLDQRQGARDIIARTIGPEAILLTGAFRMASNDDAYNSLEAVDGDGHLIGAYDKSHLVPFGEYLPLRGLMGALGLRGLAEHLPGHMMEGPGLKTISLPGVPLFSPLICYEIIFPGEVIAEGGVRPKWIVNITNDIWFGRSMGPHQHFAQARLRAVEEGVPVARAANSGISAVIDAKGRVRSQLELGAMGILDAELPAALDPPLDTRGPIWLVLALLIALWPAIAGTRRHI
jgi:apolipoprotein N-acyltransferase